MKNKLTVIIIAGNEASMIKDCVQSCLFADKIILITTPATIDNTADIAKSLSPKVKDFSSATSDIDFSAWRNEGVKHSESLWLLFLDTDERITTDLQIEILKNIEQTNITNFDIPRYNYFLGHRVKYGNSYPDYVKRLFLRSRFKGYQGRLHEQPVISGLSAKLSSPFLHYTHRNLSSMLHKSLLWTPLESQLLFDSHHPPVVWWRIIRMMLTKLSERLIKQSMWRDGTVGWISALFESFDTYLIYSQLWELQQKKVS